MESESVVNLKEFIGQLSSDEFSLAFNTQHECLEKLAKAKWAAGFECRYCGNTRYCKGRIDFSRRCTRCKKDESATAHTLFHHCRMELPRAFQIIYMVCGTPDIPASDISQLLETRHMTCLNFKKRILKCLQTEGRLITRAK